MSARIKRVYEPASEDDGYRVLVDRVWPRGVSKERAQVDAWLRELAPSSKLRKWFAHRRDRWESFQQAYHRELDAVTDREPIDWLRRRARQGSLTLVYAAREREHNNAEALRRYLENDESW